MGCSCNINESKEEDLIYQIDQDVCNKLQAEFFNYTGMVNILAQFTSDSPWKPDKERYEELLNEYLNSFARYSLIFDNIRYDIIEENNLDKSLLQDEAYIEFHTNTIRFIKK